MRAEWGPRLVYVLLILFVAATPSLAQHEGDGAEAGATTSTLVDREGAESAFVNDGRFCGARADSASVDVRGLAVVYCASSPVVAAPLLGAHASSYPAFYVIVPAAWGGAWAFRDDTDFTDAYRLTVTQLATYGVVTALKRGVGRPRPYVTLPLDSRSRRYADPTAPGARESFPSGHASLSFALATSWSLSHRQWYVVAPSLTWATLVTLSRLHLGVHYPSDVLAGAVLGAGIATAVHLLRDAITPNGLRPDDPEAAMTKGPSMQIRFRF